MAWSKPIDETELAYIEKSWPSMSCAEIAQKLGRSRRAIQNAVNRLGLREPHAPACACDEREDAAMEDLADEEQDELAELRFLRRTLKRSLQEAGPQSMPKISAEYREVLARISEIERGGDGSASKPGNELAGLIGFVPVRPT